MGPRAVMDWYRKSLTPPGFDHRTVQPVASRYTDRAMAAHVFWDIRPFSATRDDQVTTTRVGKRNCEQAELREFL